MRSKMAIAGHPIHPMLVAIPIGLFAWTLVSDIVYVVEDKDHMWYDIAFWTGIAAWISALVAALPGIGDLLAVALKTDARQMAVLHMIINVTVVALFIVAMLLMLDDGALSGGDLTLVIVLHAIGVGLLLISGWIGGEMVYRSHLAMIPDNDQRERDEQMQHVRS